ncbi:hypothetical protein D9613_006566 [Agrocybe pediades]|uniref:Uncharacterized protein n=1 Tax=Agrocybe pediades TaxID=84607 RepID=A0A8H4QHM9_9AGAR|nr:hypothetical protein D9613_006566 [Agrocybe pediades]
MKFTLPFVTAVVAFASQALASPAPPSTSTPPTRICPFITPSTTVPPQTVLQCGTGLFCCQGLGDASCLPDTTLGHLRCPRIEIPPTGA